VQAQRGFFVAKAFTRDARAQAKEDLRIELLLAKEYPALDSPVPFHFHHFLIFKNKANARLIIREMGTDPEDARFPIDSDHVTCRF
jgi:hypothetical protein